MKINMGCGDKKLEGYWNVDKSEKCKPDEVWDVTVTPYPERWEGAERIEMDNLAEHLYPATFIAVANECHRILKEGGQLWIRVPELAEGNLMSCFSDPTHVNYFTNQTFQYFQESESRHKNFGKDYGIIPWARVDQRRNNIFLEVTLTK